MSIDRKEIAREYGDYTKIQENPYKQMLEIKVNLEKS